MVLFYARTPSSPSLRVFRFLRRESKGSTALVRGSRMGRNKEWQPEETEKNRPTPARRRRRSLESGKSGNREEPKGGSGKRTTSAGSLNGCACAAAQRAATQQEEKEEARPAWCRFGARTFCPAPFGAEI